MLMQVFVAAPTLVAVHLAARDIASRCLWGGLLPAAIAFGTLLHPAALLGLFIYCVQIFGLQLRDKSPSHRPWGRALLLALTKFAEFHGILKFLLNKHRHNPATLIEYK